MSGKEQRTDIFKLHRTALPDPMIKLWTELLNDTDGIYFCENDQAFYLEEMKVEDPRTHDFIPKGSENWVDNTPNDFSGELWIEKIGDADVLNQMMMAEKDPVFSNPVKMTWKNRNEFLNLVAGLAARGFRQPFIGGNIGM